MRIVSQLFRTALAAAALAPAACVLDDAGPAPLTPSEITLDFCSNDVPIWFAYQEGNSPFAVITPNASGAFTFSAAGRVVVAYVRQRGSDVMTDIIHASDEAFAQLSSLVCIEDSGTKQVNGTVSGVTGTQVGLVNMAFSGATLDASETAFSLTQLPDRPLDLLASRIAVNGGEQQATQTILRRAQDAASGSTLPAIDFDSEGFAPTQSTVNLSGVGADDATTVSNTFLSQLQTSHTLSVLNGVASDVVSVRAVPADEMSPVEYHKLVATASSLSAGLRGAERYFRVGSNQALTIGPPLIDASVSLVSSTPHVRLRAQLLGQVEYSTMVNVALHANDGVSNRDVSMSVLASYLGGTPDVWNMPMPNFDGLPGWQNEWGLQPGDIDWTITAYFGRPQLVLGAAPNAATGETIIFGSRSSTFTATSVQGARAGQALPAQQRRAVRPGLPAHFGRPRHGAQ